MESNLFNSNIWHQGCENRPAGRNLKHGEIRYQEIYGCERREW